MRSSQWASRLATSAGEVERVEAALRRYNAALQKMDDEWYAGGICCPSCMHGAPYTTLVEKIERVEAWLVILKKKRAS